MNNEPVAYRHLHEDGWEYYDAPTGKDCKDCIPLYTHPAKTLTDEEIWKELTTVKHTWIATTSVWFEFEKEELTKAIRAILKKANNG